VVVIGGLGVTYLFVSQLIKKIKADANAAKARESIANVKGDLKAIIDSGVQPTFSPSQYDAWASEILDVFVGCDFSATFYSGSLPFASNSFMKLVSIIKQMKNDADWLSLIKSFDIKTWDDCGWWTGNVSGDLYYGISNELTQPEIDELNVLLQSHGITYKIG
jgi:hypothetical protein